MANIERILIVGGGIAGLTLATALHRQGFRAELVERSSAWHAIGAGILLHANGLRVLRALGMGKAVEQAGAVVRSWGFFDQQGEVLCDTDLEAMWGEVGPCIGIERPSLQQALRVGAAAIPCRLGTAITSLTQHEQQVSVSFSDGEAGVYDLVVGADGINSTVRKLTLGEVLPGYTGLTVRRSFAPTRLCGVTNFQILLGEGCFLGWCRRAMDTRMALGESVGHASTTRSRVAWNAFASAMQTSVGPSQNTWPPSRATSRSTAARSNGSPSSSGTVAAWCSSATQHTPARRRWQREAVWRWRMPSCWPRSCAAQTRLKVPWAAMSVGAGPEPTGCSSKAGLWLRAYSCHPPSAMPRSVSGEIRRCMTATHRSSRLRSRSGTDHSSRLHLLPHT